MIRVPKYREPTHPGEMLLEEFVPYQRINEIVNRRRGITPATALRLGRYFGNTAAFWMNLQLRWELHRAQRSEAETLQKIQPLHTAH